MKVKKLLEKIGAIAACEKVAKSDVAQVNFLFGELDDETKKSIQPAINDLHERYSEENEGASGAEVAPEAPADNGEDAEDDAAAKAAADEAAKKAEEEAKAEAGDDDTKTEDEKKAEKEAAVKAAGEAAAAKAKEEDKSEEEIEAAKKAAEEEAGKEEEEEKKIQANEKGEITIKASELEGLKADSRKLGQMIKDARKAKFEESVKALTFSETNTEGVILPKDVKEIVDFGVSLSEQQAEQYLKMLEKQKKLTGLVREFGETGAEVAAESNMFAEAFKEARAGGATEEEAKEIAKEFCEMKKKQGEI